MPTWFFHRSVYERQGGLSEIGRGFPEDQLFLLRHIYEFSGIIKRVSAPLGPDKILKNLSNLAKIYPRKVLYRFHEECMSLGVSEKSIWTMRLDYLEKHYLSRWKSFTIWSAGKQGRRLFRDLATASQEKVIAFCDVDEKKIGKNYEYQDAFLLKFLRVIIRECITFWNKSTTPLWCHHNSFGRF